MKPGQFHIPFKCEKLALPSNGVVRMADSQYIFVSSCQHDFNAVVYASYLAYSCVPLCEADPGQVSCCAFVTSPPPPCGWLPCHRLWRWGMVATALNITWGGARTRQGVPSALTGGKPVLQPHWPRSEKVNNYKMVDIVPCRETVLWVHQTVWCSSTFHILLEQSQPPGLPSPPPATFQEGSLGFGFLSAAQVNSFLWGGASFYASPLWKGTVNRELLVVAPVFYKVVFTAPYLWKKSGNKCIAYVSVSMQSAVNLRVPVSPHRSEGQSIAMMLDLP